MTDAMYPGQSISNGQTLTATVWKIKDFGLVTLSVNQFYPVKEDEVSERRRPWGPPD